MEGRKLKSVMMDVKIDELLVKMAEKLRLTQSEIIGRSIVCYSKMKYPEDAVEVQKLLESV